MQHAVRKAQAGQVGSRALANMAYGAARCGRGGMLRILVAALATAAKRRLSAFNPQEVANTAWACATVNYRDEKLFAALATASERLSGFNPALVQMALWAFSQRECVLVSWSLVS